MLCSLPISSALADSVTGTNTLENVEKGDAKGDWVEYWSDKHDGIWMVVVQNGKVTQIVPPTDTTDPKAETALMKQRATAGSIATIAGATK
jgi:uncharacterized Fe-S cluster-containing protein